MKYLRYLVGLSGTNARVNVAQLRYLLSRHFAIQLTSSFGARNNTTELLNMLDDGVDVLYTKSW